MGMFLQQAAFSCNADGCQNVITSNHDRSNIGLDQFFHHWSRAWLQFVLKDDESDKAQIAFYVFSSHLLHFDPAELSKMTRGAADYTIALVRIMRQ